MIIEFIHITGEDEWGDDHRDEFIIKVNGKNFMDFRSYGEPEDNSLDRDWNDVFKISDLIQKAIDSRDEFEEVTMISKKVTWEQYNNEASP